MTLPIDENEVEGLIRDIGMNDFKILLAAFLKECASKLDSLARNSKISDHELLELDSHTLKSLSRTFGALELGEACAKLENAAKNKDPKYYLPLFEEIKRSSLSATQALKDKYI